jgi:hypothetical protein
MEEGKAGSKSGVEDRDRNEIPKLTAPKSSGLPIAYVVADRIQAG